MITCNVNNFGSPAISFVDYQDPALCILNGSFFVDPTNAAYQAVQQLEIELPADFVLPKSAVSAVTLISGHRPNSFGTVLRCWIENRRLCIEKLTNWDEFGTYEIVVSSGFVARGYRGEFQRLRRLALATTTNDYKVYMQGCAYTDDFLYLVLTFDRFPSSYDSKGPFSIRIEGLLDDFDAHVAIVAQCSARGSGDVGNGIVHARIQGGVLHFRYPEGVTNFGGQENFFIMYAVRGNFTPSQQIAGSLALSLDDVAETGVSTVTALDATLCDGFATIDTAMSRNSGNNNGFSQQFDVSRDLDMIPDTLTVPTISRGSKSTSYRTCINAMTFNRHFRSVDLRQYYARMQSDNIEAFGTVPITTNII